jgi:RNA polymerase sigma factor (sigma-70 family)
VAAGHLESILDYVRSLTARSAGGDSSDRALLERFASERDQAAFEQLMHKHGRMVFNVCRRVLGDDHAADDAFQATFITLARKSAGLRHRGTLAGWLYTVAYHAALKARRSEMRRRERERQAQRMVPSSPSEELAWHDLSTILDEEVQRLPERYRTAFVLCCLQGLTNEEAASALGCPTGTVLSRLSRAREQLRGRLTRRGVTLSLAALASLVTEHASAAVVPGELARQTLTIVFEPGQAVPAAAIATGVIRTMTIVKVTRAALVFVALFGIGGGVLAYRAVTGGPKPAPNEDRNLTANARDDLEKKAAPPTQDEIKKAEEALKKEIGADFKSAKLLDAGQILRNFPDWLIFDVRFMYQYGVPLGRIEGSACWAIHKKTGQRTRLGAHGIVSVAELKKFLESNLPEAKDEGAVKDALWACLRITQEAFTDHRWMDIKLDESSIKVAGKTASGKSVVAPPGQGFLTVSLDQTRKPARIEIDIKIVRPPKPVCQATRLLDPDPVIRKMAEQQLLLMGKYAEEYLQQRRVEAESPELRAAIDAIWKRIQDEDGKRVERTLVRPDLSLLRHKDRIVRRITRQQLELLGEVPPTKD